MLCIFLIGQWNACTKYISLWTFRKFTSFLFPNNLFNGGWGGGSKLILWLYGIIFRWLTHYSQVMHICVGQLTLIGSDNGLLPGRRQVNILASARILLIRALGTKFNESVIKMHAFSFIKMHWKMSSGKWRPLCLGLTVLRLIWMFAGQTDLSWKLSVGMK